MSEAPTPDVSGLTFWRSPTGLLRVTGADRVDLLHRLSTQDLRPLKTPGHTADTLFTTAQGRALAWVRICAAADALWLTCAPDRAGPLAAWIARYTIMEDVVAEDCGDAWHQVQIFGATAHAALALAAPPPAGRWVQVPWALGADQPHMATALLPAWGPGTTVVMPAAAASDGATGLAARGAQALSEAQWEYLRIQAGVPSALYELQGEVNPFEMRLAASTVHWHKGCYIGQEVISRLDSYNKVARLLVGFSSPVAMPEDLALPLKVSAGGRPLGRVTSWVPTGRGCVGLALVKKAATDAPASMEAEIVTPDKTVPIVLESRPFWTGD